MAMCEICGKTTELFFADIEGVELQACSSCAPSGSGQQRKPLSSISRSTTTTSPYKELPSVKITTHFASLLKSSRETRRMTREEFAKLLNQRESLIAQWEQGGVKPTVEVAQLLERKLGISLVEKDEEEAKDVSQKKSSDSLTLGDFIVIKKRK